MFPKAQNKEWIKSEIEIRHDFSDRIKKIKDKISSRQFKDGLSGVYGNFDQKIFEKHRDALLGLISATG